MFFLGKTNIKILEKDLMQIFLVKESYSDPHFNKYVYIGSPVWSC